MNSPKVYLYDLKEEELPTLYFQDHIVTGLYCLVCKEQHGGSFDHPIPNGWDFSILRKAHKDIINVARENWLEESTNQIRNIVNALWQAGFEDCNIFVFRKFLSDGTCDIGSIGRKGTAKKKTHGKLQAVADNFTHRLGKLKAFW